MELATRIAETEMAVLEELTRLDLSLNEAKIEFPYPQRDLHLRTIDRQAADNLGRLTKS